MNLLPSGSSTEYSGRVITSEDQYKQALAQLEQKADVAIAKFTGKPTLNGHKAQEVGDIVVFSQRVQKISNLFAALNLAVTSNGLSPRIITSKSCETLIACFDEAVRGKEVIARGAFEKGHVSLAYESYITLQQALKYEIGSERYFFIQECTLATLIRQDKISEAIDLLLELDKSVPQNFKKHHGVLRSAVIENVKSKFGSNEASLKEVREEVALASGSITKILSKDSLQKKQGLSFILQQLEPVQRQLDACGAILEECEGKLIALNGLCRRLKLDLQSQNQAVTDIFTYWNDLTNSAIELLSKLESAESDEDRNAILRAWIQTNINKYACTEVELSALHGWALLHLGKLFFSKELSQDSLDATVTLVRTNARILFTHLKAFPCDVQLCFGKYRIHMSILVLATISNMLQRDCCSQDQIQQLQTWSFRGVWDSLPLVGRTEEPEKPRIDLSDLIREMVVHAKDPENIFNQLSVAFQRNQYEFSELTPEEIVVLFELADLLEMPFEVAELSINPLHTPAFEQKLSAFLWLRLVQARRLLLPYSTLEERLPALSSDDFLKLITLYDPKRLTIDPQEHHRLFFAIAAAAERLFEGKMTFTEKQVIQIFAFLSNLYVELLDMGVELPIKNSLDTKMIQFGCRCIASTNSVDYCSSENILSRFAYLDSQALTDIVAVLNPTARSWLDTSVFPNLTTLILHEGLYAEEIHKFANCSSLTALSMPLTGESSSHEVQELARAFPLLQTLTLSDGEVSLPSLNALNLRSLTLKKISNRLDFSSCRDLQRNLQELCLVDVDLEPGTLAWVGMSQSLTYLSIWAKSGAQIGSLAERQQAHAHPTLRSIRLMVDSLEQDPELVQSLPKLLDSHSTIASIALFASSQQSLLKCLLESKKAATVKELTLSCNPSEDLELLSQFSHLTKLTFQTDDQDQIQRIQAFNFKACKKLRGYSIVGSGGQTMSIDFSK